MSDYRRKKEILDFLELAFEKLKAKILITSDDYLASSRVKFSDGFEDEDSVASDLLELVRLMAYKRGQISTQFFHPVHPV